jgi:hypothetical protein
MVTTGLVPVVFATAAYANVVSISFSNCGKTATFAYGDIPTGTNQATETVTLTATGKTLESKTFAFSTTTGVFTDMLSYSADNGDSVIASSTFTTSAGTFTNSNTTVLSGCGKPNSLNVFVGYADTLRAPSSPHFPTLWDGAAGVTFLGCSPSSSARTVASQLATSLRHGH